MNAVGEPDSFDIDHKFLEILAAAIPGEILYYGFQRSSNFNIVFVVLIPDDVPAGERRLIQII